MKNTFTPGPWFVGAPGNKICAGESRSAYCGTIAHIYGHFDLGQLAMEDASNARLIAAAPDMLAALKACVADGFLAGDVLDMAAAAIEKAKG